MGQGHQWVQHCLHKILWWSQQIGICFSLNRWHHLCGDIPWNFGSWLGKASHNDDIKAILGIYWKCMYIEIKGLLQIKHHLDKHHILSAIWTIDNIIPTGLKYSSTTKFNHIIRFGKKNVDSLDYAIGFGQERSTVEPLYNTIVFHQNTHKKHPIARP